ncbi:MAG TPA: transcription-repair coupling factor [Nitrospiria bacterium]
MQQPSHSTGDSPFFYRSFCEPALQAFRKGGDRLILSGLWGSSKAALLSGTARLTGQSMFVLTATDAEAESFYNDLRLWNALSGRLPCKIILFPSTEVLPYEWSHPHPDIVRKRMQALFTLSLQGRSEEDARGRTPVPFLLVSSVHGIFQKVIAPDAFRKSTLMFSTGEETGRDRLIDTLDGMGYTRVPMVTHPGEFAIRGGLMDIFAPPERFPARLEWADDRIESIRSFDPDNQVTFKDKDGITILPADEAPEKAEASLWDHLPSGTRLVWNEPERILDQAEGFDKEVSLAGENSRQSRKGGKPVYLSFRDIESRFREASSITLRLLPEEEETGKNALVFKTGSTENAGLGRKGTPLERTIEIVQRLRAQSRVIVAGKTPAQRDRIIGLLNDHDIPAATWSEAEALPQDPAGLPVFVLSGELSAGFVDPSAGLAVLTDEDLFGRAAKHRPLPKPSKKRFLAAVEDLSEGDYIVHVQHGIGRYEGLRRLTVEGFESDFLIVRYLGGDVLYVPVDHMNLVQKYSGVEGRSARLDRLGGITWAKTTKRVKKAVESMAREILDLYAARETARGHGFSPDTAMNREFDAAFPYVETPDQARTIGEVRSDMERARPMDRLVCGDVGYGKTEVAMRAAFKTVMDGKQVAVLVPTTLLAQQHGENFQERFSPFPVRVETLSRFKKPKEQKATLSDLSQGKVDIIIGTHRLLQKDVSFRDLGLLVVDEEQRFGVRNKERLKQLRKSVDTLTLTATPIPRTLQMSLTGIRDLSIIETPPADRLAVRTILTRFDGHLIRNAIRRELSRDGQVFFIHNRVHDIARIGRLVKDLVPEGKIAVAHGQMPEKALEKVMRDFVHRKTNILITTTIVESGLDIPSANTILVNDAQRFGLSDLYQLRGRVGRSGHQAYAYLLVPSERGLTEEARGRIQAIQEFSDLGAGFRIAARDLEIRGSGNFLGVQQSGHIAAVGFEYYLQLIEQSVREMKGEAVEEGKEPAINLRVSAFLPHDFIPDTFQRLSAYKRLSGLESDEELASYRKELEDRYGALPEPVRGLLGIVSLRILARRSGIEKIEGGEDGYTITFDKNQPLGETPIRRILDGSSGLIQLRSEFSIEIKNAPTADDGPSDGPGPGTGDFAPLKNYLEKLLF